MKTTDTFRVIRVTSDCSCMVVASPEHTTLSSKNGNFYLHNLYIQERGGAFFITTARTGALAYFSGIADGMGWTVPPDRVFTSLAAIEKWAARTARASKRKTEIETWAGCFALVDAKGTTATRRHSNAFLKSVQGLATGRLVFKQILVSTAGSNFHAVRALKLLAKSSSAQHPDLKNQISRKIAQLKKR